MTVSGENNCCVYTTRGLYTKADFFRAVKQVFPEFPKYEQVNGFMLLNNLASVGSIRTGCV